MFRCSSSRTPLCGALLLLAACLSGAQKTGVQIPTVEVADGVNMPVISIGTGGLEGREAKTIVETWVRLGGKGIDGAWNYRNQDVVREAVAEIGAPREELFITSKIPGCVDAAKYVEEDLRQLGVDYIDLLLIHFPSRVSSECQATWKGLEEYHARGKLKAIGVSNFRPEHLEPLLQSAKVKPAVNQIQHNVLEHDDETLAFCAAHNIAVEAYSPVGRSGHSGDISGNKDIQAIAVQHNVSSFQVALRWILQHGHILTVQSATEAHQAADADVFGFSLTAEEMGKLDSLQAAQAKAAATSEAAPEMTAIVI